MKGKEYKYVLNFKRTPNAPMKTNKMFYNRKMDAQHDLQLLKTKYSKYYKNPRIKKV